MPENMMKAWKTLSKYERVVLLNVVKYHKDWHDMHIGLLPFKSLLEVRRWLSVWMLGNGNTRRIHHEILAKLDVQVIEGRLPLTLNTAKVIARFGRYPERGVIIPGIPNTKYVRCPKETCTGDARDCRALNICERRPFEKKADAYDVQAQLVSLFLLGGSKWRLSCDDSIRVKVTQWLEENMR